MIVILNDPLDNRYMEIINQVLPGFKWLVYRYGSNKKKRWGELILKTSNNMYITLGLKYWNVIENDLIRGELREAFRYETLEQLIYEKSNEFWDDIISEAKRLDELIP